MLSVDEFGQRRARLVSPQFLPPLGVRHEILDDLEQLGYEGLAGSLDDDSIDFPNRLTRTRDSKKDYIGVHGRLLLLNNPK